MSLATSGVVAGQRPTIRCGHCNLVQFITHNGHCRRCDTLIPIPVPDVPLSFTDCPPIERFTPQSGPRRFDIVSLSEIIRFLRASKGMTQAMLSRVTKLSRPALNKLEVHHMISLRSVERVASAFGISENTLLSLPHSILQDPFVIEVLTIIRRNPKIAASIYNRVRTYAK